MDLGDILGELERVPGDARWLRALGGALGVELSRRRLEQLVPVLRVLARPSTGGGGASSFGAGYAAALQDVALAFQAELGAEVEDLEVVRLAQTSPYLEALAAIASGNTTVTAIGVAMGKNKSSASRALAVLREAGLIAGFASSDGNERSRPHALTPRGRHLLDQMQSQKLRAAKRKATPLRGSRVASAFTASLPRRSR